MQFYSLFIQAIHQKQILTITMNSKEKGIITRTCAPLDFGTHKGFPDKGKRYMLYHFETKHVSPMLPEQIIRMNITSQNFEPKEVINWSPPYNWHIPRDWEDYS